jgi:FAD synthetase
LFSEKERVDAIRRIDLVDKVVLGDQAGYIKHIKRIAPDIIALGYDQKAYTESLAEDLTKAGLTTKIVRIRGHKVHIYKSSLLKKQRITI